MSRPAVDSSGNLKDASELLFYHSESDTHPIAGSTPNLPASATSSSKGEYSEVSFLFTPPTKYLIERSWAWSSQEEYGKIGRPISC